VFDIGTRGFDISESMFATRKSVFDVCDQCSSRAGERFSGDDQRW
jgi:hypothetical protein